MKNGSIHRLDRRPSSRFDLQHVRNRPVRTSDGCQSDLDDEEMEQIERTDTEIELALNGSVDLIVVLSACFAMSRDAQAGKYTLLAHNCFFFSWTILMIVSRFSLPYETPKQELLLRHIEPQLRNLTGNITDETIGFLIDVTVEVVNLMRRKTGEETHDDMNTIMKLARCLPTNLFRCPEANARPPFGVCFAEEIRAARANCPKNVGQGPVQA